MAEASLQGRSLSGPWVDGDATTFEAYFDAGQGISWTQDANLFKTVAAASGDAAGFVTTVINAVGGQVYDTPNLYDTPPNSGYHTLSAADFNTTTGTVSWFGAQAWVSFLNVINYGGYADWRLPAIPLNVSGYDSASEFGQLFYKELGGVAAHPISLSHNANYELFTGINDGKFWSGTELSSPASAKDYWFNSGTWASALKNNANFSVWAVRTGDIAPVPLPGAVWLLGSGLMGVLGFRRKRT